MGNSTKYYDEDVRAGKEAMARATAEAKLKEEYTAYEFELMNSQDGIDESIDVGEVDDGHGLVEFVMCGFGDDEHEDGVWTIFDTGGNQYVNLPGSLPLSKALWLARHLIRGLVHGSKNHKEIIFINEHGLLNIPYEFSVDAELDIGTTSTDMALCFLKQLEEGLCNDFKTIRADIAEDSESYFQVLGTAIRNIEMLDAVFSAIVRQANHRLKAEREGKK